MIGFDAKQRLKLLIFLESLKSDSLLVILKILTGILDVFLQYNAVVYLDFCDPQ